MPPPRSLRFFSGLQSLSPWVLDALILAVPVGLYLHLALWRLDLPGLHGEEVATLFPILSWIRGWEGKLLLLSGYHGPYESVLALPFLLVLGQTATAVRICVVFYSALTIAAAYWLMRRSSGSRWAAAASALLLALSPSFVIGSRVGMAKGVMVPLLALFAMTFTLLWLQERQKNWLLWAAAAWGLTAGCRIWSLVLMAAWGTSLALCYPVAIKNLRRQPATAASALAVFALILLTPYLIDNIRTNPPWHTIQLLLERHSGPELSLWGSFLHRIKDFQWHIGGIAYFHEQATVELKHPLESVLRAGFSTKLFWAGILCIGPALWSRRKEYLPFAFLGLLAPLSLLLLAFSRSGQRLDHLYMLVPFVPLFYAAGLVAATDIFRRRATMTCRAICVAVMAVVVWEDVRLLRAYRGYLSEVGGFGEYSPALTDMSDFIRSQGFERVYFPWQESSMRMSLAFQNDWAVDVSSIDPEDIPLFEKFIVEAGPSTAFVRVGRWRAGVRYPLSAALRRYAKQKSLTEVRFQARPNVEEFALYYRD